MPPKAKRHTSDHDGKAGRASTRKIADGTAAMAKRIAPSSAGPNDASPARIAGNAEAHATTVIVTATIVVVSMRAGGLLMATADMKAPLDLIVPGISAA